MSGGENMACRVGAIAPSTIHALAIEGCNSTVLNTARQRSHGIWHSGIIYGRIQSWRVNTGPKNRVVAISIQTTRTPMAMAKVLGFGGSRGWPFRPARAALN